MNHIGVLSILAMCYLTLPTVAQQTDESEVFSVAQMQADVEQLDQAIGTNWSYLDDKVANLGLDYEGLLRQLKAEINQPLAKHEFGKHVVRFVSGMNDGYAFAAAPTFAAEPKWQMPHRALPIQIAEVEEGIVVTSVVNHATSSGKNAGIEKGDLLRSIDGKEIEQIITERAKFVSASTDAARRLIAVRQSVFLDKQEAVVLLETSDGTKNQVKLPTLARNDPQLEEQPEENWTLRFHNNVAIFRISEFSIEDWNQWTETAVEDRDKLLTATYEAITNRFREIHEHESKPRALVIDVRGNGGGTDLIGIHVARHLLNDRFRYFLLSARLLDGSWTPFSGITYTPIEDVGARWSGPLHLLVDEDCFSTTDNFLRCLVDLRQDTIVIGRPTGGGTGAPRQLAQLTHSQINVFGCTQRVQGPRGIFTEGRSTVPDHLIQRTRQDIVDGNDPELEKALQLSNANDH